MRDIAVHHVRSFALDDTDAQIDGLEALLESIRSEALDDAAKEARAACSGVIPGTFVVCGEGGNYCSKGCQLAAAAPQLVRALLAVEWSGWDHDPYDDYKERACPDCEEPADRIRHTPACSLDAALTAAGFETQESRDEARKVMGER